MFFIPPGFVLLREVAEALDVPLNSLNLSATFLENGGNSLSLIRLLHTFKKHGIRLSHDFVFSISTLAQLLQSAGHQMTAFTEDPTRPIKRRLSSADETAFKKVRKGEDGSFRLVPTSHAFDGLNSCPMTEMQAELLQGTLREPGMNVIHYHETHCSENIPAIREAWKALTKVEPMLRTTYEFRGTTPYLVECDRETFDWEEAIVEDKTAYEHRIREANVKEIFFGSSFRVVTFRPKKKGHLSKSRLVWRVHHALMDGYSHDQLRWKIGRYLTGKAINPGPLFSQYVAGLQELERRSAQVATNFWNRVCEQHPKTTSQLKLAEPYVETQIDIEHYGTVTIDTDGKELRYQVNKLGITLPTLYYAAWALLMAKYTDGDDICFGVVLCGRTIPVSCIDSIVGSTINTLPLHITIDRSITFSEFTKQIFQRVLELTSFQWTSPKHGYRRDFDTAVNAHGYSNDMHRWPFKMLEAPFSTVRSEIPLQIETGRDGRVRFHYNPAHYPRQQIDRISQMYKNALSLAWSPSALLSDCLPNLLEGTHLKTLRTFGSWESPSSRMGSVQDDLVSLFLGVIRRAPDATAIEHGCRTITYRELDTSSTAIARHILPLVQSGSIVCVLADRTPNWIVAIYAVLKAGAVYCPLDHDLPQVARDRNFETSGAKVFLVGSRVDKEKKPKSCEICLSVEELLGTGPPSSANQRNRFHNEPSNPNAYLCFTSGSTGKPKGVLCRHQGLVAFQSDFKVRLCSRAGWKIAQFMSPAFDGSIHEIFSTLSYGATLILRERFNPLSHLKKADAAILTPSIARALKVDDFPNLKMVYLVGEAVPQDVCDAWASEKVVYNMYGPTEGTCGATIKQLLPYKPVTLGKPNPSTRIYILDPHRQLTPLGVIGEVWLAGIQVAAGYFGQPAETEQRFMRDTINPEFKEHMYRTGDRGYWNDSGELVFVGRSDRQCKLHGFRIDLDDLEIQILRASTESTRVAVAAADGYLVAHVQPHDVDVRRLKEELRSSIPAYALPRHVMAVHSFPVTATGKLDYKTIAQEIRRVTRKADDLKISSTDEDSIISVVCDVLGLVPSLSLGGDSNFLALGATSMHLLSLSQRISKLFERKVTVEILLKYPSARELCQALARIDALNRPGQDGVLGEEDVSPIEQYWLERYRADSNTSSFNVNYACALDGSVDTKRLLLAWNVVLSRHRILRCQFQHLKENQYHRSYRKHPPIAKLVKQVNIDVEVNAPFQVWNGELIRVLVSPSHMVAVMSHIICDLTTLNILLKEVSEQYRGHMLPPIRTAYSETRWEAFPLPSHSNFWIEYMKDAKSVAFPHGASFPRTTWAGTSQLFKIPKLTHAFMQSYLTRNTVTAHQLACAAVGMALHDSSSSSMCDIVIGAPYLNRHSEEDQAVVGLFLEPLPLRIQFPCSDVQERGNDSYIRAVQKSSRAALAHAISFQRLLQILGIDPQYPNHPVFDVMVTYHEFDHRPVLPIEGVRPLDLWSQGAKFKLMVEFSTTDDAELAMRLEYSTEVFDEVSISRIGNKISRALQGLSEGVGFDDVTDLVNAPG